jgi:prepilin-type processing-associated H-X9-DG protein
VRISQTSQDPLLRRLPGLQKRRHSGKFNAWFCDGHIEYLPFDNFTSHDEVRLRRWNNDNLPHKDLLPFQ